MGAWNSTPFGNDSALDFLTDLERQEDLEQFLMTTIGKISSDWNGDCQEAEEGVAAIAFVSASAVDPIGPINQEAKRLIATTGFIPSDQLLALSLSALERICTDSELKDLWEESGSLTSWLKQTERLANSLRNAAAAGLPSRTPKKPGMPRSLHKLLERYTEGPSDKIRARIRKMVNSIIDVNEQNANSNWKSPLSLICQYGLLDEVQELLSRGADPITSEPNPFVAACVGGHIEVAELLRQNGVKVFFTIDRQAVEGAGNHLDDIMLGQMRIRGIEPKPKRYSYCLALFAVAREGKPRAAEYLVSIGADLHQTDLNDENLVHKAAEGGNIEMLSFLVASGLDPSKPKGKFAESPLHYAVRAGKLNAVLTILEHGADPNHIDKFEGAEHKWYQTPLDICENDKIRELLLKFGGKSAAEIMGANKK
ncbi:MAG: DUF4259 domain-containing protein [Burkholderiales bacterium]|nr:DUF4259 domain-containing protein [Burkholderiales bacterium]